MTARHCAYLVTLDHDVREDDAEAGVLTALRCIRGVVSVEPVEGDHFAEEAGAIRERNRLREVIWPVLYPEVKR